MMSNRVRSIAREAARNNSEAKLIEAAAPAAPIVLTAQASHAFLSLTARRKQLEEQINSIALGAGIIGEYHWSMDERSQIVTLFHGRPAAPAADPRAE